MRANHDTPAFQARLLHHVVKAFFAEMEHEGFNEEAGYMVLLNVVMRMAYEKHGDAGIDEILGLMDKLAEGRETPHLRVV